MLGKIASRGNEGEIAPQQQLNLDRYGAHWPKSDFLITMSAYPEADAAAEANLKALECLMDEFFSSDVSNFRKAEIERLLNDFGQQVIKGFLIISACIMNMMFQASCWSDSLGFLNRTSNPYVSMFALTTIENTIRKRWVGMQASEKGVIRNQLHFYLVKHHTSIPAYIRNKVIKLLVDIACTDWPHFYPTFFTDITSWIHGGSETVLIGLSCLLIASEELATPRDNVASARKEELKRLLVTQVPQIMSSLLAVLESLLYMFQGGATARLTTATPPPSPSPSGSHDEDSNSADGSRMLRLRRPPVDHTAGLLHVAKGMLNTEGPVRLDAGTDVVEVATVALKCLNHLFTWVPLSTVISSRLLASIFHFAGLGIPCVTVSV